MSNFISLWFELVADCAPGIDCLVERRESILKPAQRILGGARKWDADCIGSQILAL